METRTGEQLQVNYKKVPSVQEMAKNKLVTIPSRYVRDNQDRSFVASSNNKEVPVIDMQRLINSSDHDSMNLELNKLHIAAKEWGFFQLINHGVNSSLVEKMKNEIKELFNLPLEEKKKFEQSSGELDGFGQHFVVSDEQKLDWADLFYLKTAPPYLRMPIFSKLPLSLRETIEEYSEEVKELSIKVLKMLGKALGIDEEEVKSLFEEGMQSMRMNYYPPCPQPEKVMGLAPHSDATGLTILLQVNDIQGLQIKKDEIWISILPLPRAFIVNVGDVFEIFSNGIYKSIEHRSVVSSEKERISIATFHNSRLDAKEWGFFQLINHGVNFSMMEKMKDEIKKLFNLPLEEKKKFEQSSGELDGFGQLFVVSDEQKLDWADLFVLKTAPTYLRRPIFSKLPFSLRETIEEYSKEVNELSMKVLEMLGKALGIDEEEVKSVFEEGMQSMRMNYYPPCPQPEKVMGLCPHSDSSGLTILLQVNEIEGLQIKKNGIWIPILPLPNAFVVNVGDALEVLIPHSLIIYFFFSFTFLLFQFM
ncbi:hypothetical protein KY289_015645 [Solanum tuberosum]|nr:hypothetical protein KY289_015645 [Solanum tuberosum]